jgi:hypothetical protein
MGKRLIRKSKTDGVKTCKRLLAMILIGALLFSLCGCSGQKVGSVDGIKPAIVEREPLPQAIQTANKATTIALRQYIFARLKTENFVTADIKAMQREELTRMVDELAESWKIADQLASGAEKISDQALVVLDTTKMNQTSVYDQLIVSLKAHTSKFFVYPVVAFAAGNSKEFDPKTWAESLTKKYDSIKGGQTIKQLAKQLGTDAKEAYAKLTLAQEIIHSGAMADAEYYDKLTKIAQGTKTACKVGLLVTATIASGGGTLSTLAGSSMTLGQAGAAIVGGTDCIVDVYSTGSTIILGENHQVTVGFDDIKNKLAPVSAVIGLATFNPAETGEQLSYIGDTLADWFYEGKILGVKVIGNKSGGTTVKSQPIDVSGKNEKEINDAMKQADFIPPAQKTAVDTSTAREAEAEKLEISRQEVIAILDSLASQMAAIVKSATQIEESAKPGNANEALEELGLDTLTGTYSGTMTMTKVEVVYDSENVDKNGNILHVYRPDGKSEWEGMAIKATLKLVQEGNLVRVLDEDGGTTFELEYDPTTSQWKSKQNLSQGTKTVIGEFSNSNGKIHVNITVTETYEKSEMPDGINETVIELTRSN